MNTSYISYMFIYFFYIYICIYIYIYDAWNIIKVTHVYMLLRSDLREDLVRECPFRGGECGAETNVLAVCLILCSSRSLWESTSVISSMSEVRTSAASKSGLLFAPSTSVGSVASISFTLAILSVVSSSTVTRSGLSLVWMGKLPG